MSDNSTLPTTCAQCGAVLLAGQGVAVEDRVFCAACYDALASTVRKVLDEQTRGIAYPLALIGALGGGLLGAVAWYLFTTLTGILFGLIAVVIGYTTARGMLKMTGGKRSRGLQIMSAVVSLACFAIATYFVNVRFGLPGLHFDMMDIVFAAITAYEGWVIPRPFLVD